MKNKPRIERTGRGEKTFLCVFCIVKFVSWNPFTVFYILNFHFPTKKIKQKDKIAVVRLISPLFFDIRTWIRKMPCDLRKNVRTEGGEAGC